MDLRRELHRRWWSRWTEGFVIWRRFPKAFPERIRTIREREPQEALDLVF
jgi:hypothetical protein